MITQVSVTDQAFDPYAEAAHFQAAYPSLSGQYGATSLFIGTMRDFNEGDRVRAMTLEHYPGMTERQLGLIVDEAAERWELLAALIIHRVGSLHPDQPIVLVGVWSAHRGPAFDASRYLMEALKHRAPFWKKETLPDRNRWVERNTRTETLP